MGNNNNGHNSNFESESSEQLGSKVSFFYTKGLTYRDTRFCANKTELLNTYNTLMSMSNNGEIVIDRKDAEEIYDTKRTNNDFNTVTVKNVNGVSEEIASRLLQVIQ